MIYKGQSQKYFFNVKYNRFVETEIRKQEGSLKLFIFI